MYDMSLYIFLALLAGIPLQSVWLCVCAVGTQAERIPVAKRLSLANCQLPGQVNYLAKTINRKSERDR